ncbi:MAG TPA: hypothetical protein VGK09_03135 [Rhodocyclaceae bacterium]|jgi:hypothetical protein
MLIFNMRRALRRTVLVAVSVTAVMAASAAQADGPKIAVTDLSYEEKVREYFQNYEFKGKYDSSSSARENYRDSDYSSSGSASARSRDKGEVSIRSSSGFQTYIDRGELRKFTADVKGELLKSGYRLVQGKPWTQQNTEKLYDIINRIKQGYYPGADYVLWGSINNVEFRRDDNPIQGSNAFSHTLALELVAEFSLINTRTYEIKAAFSAMGEGSDTKMTNAPGTSLTLNRSKVMQEVSRSLGEAVAQEVEAQFSGGASSSRRGFRDNRNDPVVEEKTIIFK